MTRERISLDGTWSFRFDPQASGALHVDGSWREIRVPRPWQSQFEDLRLQSGTAWYRRTFVAPPDWNGHSAILHFGAVDYYAEVWLNEVLLGAHEGGYLPFEFDVGPYLHFGEANEVVVRVTDPTPNAQRYPDWPFDEIPHGKQSWYGPTSGIWQSVWLERRSSLHVAGVRLYPDLGGDRLRAVFTLLQAAQQSCSAELCILAPEGTVVSQMSALVAAGDKSIDVRMAVPSPRPWSPADPCLYQLQATLLQEGQEADSVREAFGFRTIEARTGRLYLNGEPLYLRGALDQDYYPDTVTTPPSEEFLANSMRRAKEMGLNCLRCHIKVPDPLYFAVADRVGMLVWSELPSWRWFSDSAAERARVTLRGMVERDGNHPSIIAWTVVNEGWGLDLPNQVEHRAWLRQTYDWLKELDPSRLVVDNSPCWPNFHLQSDLDDYHLYRAIPDHVADWDYDLGAFAARQLPTFGRGAEVTRSGEEPLILSEFGSWGLPDVDLLVDGQGREPWWFETGFEWGDGSACPHGVRQRFYAWHLDSVFGTWRAFVEATQGQQLIGVKHQVESIRLHSSIAGYVITELSDAHWECNGLLDMQRNPKAFHDELAAINADTVIVPRCDRMAYWAGEPVVVRTAVAHGAGSKMQQAQLHWHCSTGAAGSGLAAPAVDVGQVVHTPTVVFPAPQVSEATMAELELELVSPEGQRLAANRVPLAFLPRRSTSDFAGIALWAQDTRTSDALGTLGYRLVRDLRYAQVAVARSLDRALHSYIYGGGQVLLLANAPDAVGPYVPGIRAVARKGSPWEGDWISTFSWLRRCGPFARLPGGPLLDLSFQRVIPEYVLTGFGPFDYETDVHGGLFVGWVHKPVALLAERRLGKGRVVLTTLRPMVDSAGVDPVATTLLDALIALARGGA